MPVDPISRVQWHPPTPIRPAESDGEKAPFRTGTDPVRTGTDPLRPGNDPQGTGKKLPKAEEQPGSVPVRGVELETSVDQTTNRVITKFISSSTGEVIRQFPTEQLLQIAKYAKEKFGRTTAICCDKTA